jgi:hypothetical protein
MKYICLLCSVDPLSHSLNEVFEKNNVIYYYTCPSKAKMYFDTLGIINHYDGVLSEIPENKKWIWIFDGTDFGVKHVLQIEVAIELAKLISSKFSDKLEKIIIINSNFYIKSIYNIVYFFLNTKLKSIVEMNYEFKTVNDIIKISE